MENQSIHKEVKESLERFELLAEIQPSEGWEETLNRRLTSSGRGKARPLLTFAMAALVLINAGFIIKVFVAGDNADTQKRQKMEAIAGNILINPDSANN